MELHVRVRCPDTGASVWRPAADPPSDLGFEFECEFDYDLSDSDLQAEDLGFDARAPFSIEAPLGPPEEKCGPHAGWTLAEGKTCSESDVPPEWCGKTSIMVRNLPYKCTPTMFYREVCNAGFEDLVDYIYVPVNHKGSTCKGYAFANFVDPSSAYRFYGVFDGKKMCIPGSKKLLEVTPAFLQGYDQNCANNAQTSRRVSAGVVFDSRRGHGAQDATFDEEASLACFEDDHAQLTASPVSEYQRRVPRKSTARNRSATVAHDFGTVSWRDAEPRRRNSTFLL
eukprot:TRINITY_DN43035_c0_g1_i1.p1 TRINITY_DN43035_c0_g1~~TRINITY_DN43035_c0_g1_i1.p1  ORF type:complete len:283 (+),score=44.39 TRINITY_DN43035_c0_g1_i1:224-1072(+)